MSISGWNWGNAAVDTATMVFTVGSKPAFRIPLKDVNQVQQSKEEVCFQPAARTKIHSPGVWAGSVCILSDFAHSFELLPDHARVVVTPRRSSLSSL